MQNIFLNAFINKCSPWHIKKNLRYFCLHLVYIVIKSEALNLSASYRSVCKREVTTSEVNLYGLYFIG
jgi:hypothetical protein